MRKLYTLIVVFCFCLPNIVRAKDTSQYPASAISPQLLEHADAVIRLCKTEISIVSATEIYVKEYIALTILNTKGYKYAKLEEYYDKFDKIQKIGCVILDKDGNKVKTVKQSEIIDRSSYETNFYDDSRVKEYQVQYSVFPFTVVCEVERKLTSSFFVPGWNIQPEHNVSVEASQYTLQYPEFIHVRHKLYHTNEHVVETIGNGYKSITGNAKKIPAIEEDILRPAEGYPLPMMDVAVDELILDGQTGLSDNWRNFGSFFYKLNAGRQELPVSVKQAVHELTDTCTSTYSKVDLLYQYLQNNTRYVSIQVGIGGWQSFPASFVAEKKYGDCKALSNYMVSLLKEAGIVAYVALVYAGQKDIKKVDAGFTANVFNHAIAYIPLPDESIWIECTAKKLPAGYLSDFTEDRDVLVLMPAGGQLAHTPAYTASENKVVRKTVIQLDSTDVIRAQVEIKYKGAAHDKEMRIVDGEPDYKIKKHLNEKFELPSHEVTTYKIAKMQEEYIPVLTEEVSLTGKPVMSRLGSHLYIQPCIMPMEIPLPQIVKARSKPFYISSSYTICDTSVISIPGDYATDYMPENISLKHEFGSYSCNIAFADNKMTVVRYYEQRKGIYAADKYADFVKFIKSATYSGDGSKVALIKKQ